MHTGVIYQIECLVNQKKYIGSSINFANRKSVHLRELKKGKHHSIKLQRAFDLYGEFSFSFSILEELKNQPNLFLREQYWIDYFDSYENGYNSTKYAIPSPKGDINGMFGKKPHNFGVESTNRKPVTSYCIKTGIVVNYDCVLDAIKDIGGPQFLTHLKKPLEYRKFKNKFWFYKNDFNLENLKIKFEILMTPNPLKGKIRSDEDRRKISEGKKGKSFSESHCVNLGLARLNKFGRKIIRSDGMIFDTINEAGRQMNCHPSSISKHLSKPKIGFKTVKGFTFEFFEE